MDAAAAQAELNSLASGGQKWAGTADGLDRHVDYLHGVIDEDNARKAATQGAAQKTDDSWNQAAGAANDYYYGRQGDWDKVEPKIEPAYQAINDELDLAEGNGE